MGMTSRVITKTFMEELAEENRKERDITLRLTLYENW